MSIYTDIAALEYSMKNRWPCTHTEPPASVKEVLWLKDCTTTRGNEKKKFQYFYKQNILALSHSVELRTSNWYGTLYSKHSISFSKKYFVHHLAKFDLIRANGKHKVLTVSVVIAF